jgi:hypothetical protein
MRKPSAPISSLLLLAAASMPAGVTFAAGVEPGAAEAAGPVAAPVSPVEDGGQRTDASPRPSTAMEPAQGARVQTDDDGSDREAARRWRDLVPGSIQ